MVLDSRTEGTLLIVLAGIKQQVATFDRCLSKPKKIERVQVCHDGSLALQRVNGYCMAIGRLFGS